MTDVDRPNRRVSVTPFWALLLKIMAAGKSAVGGAGIAIAALGLINSLVLIIVAADAVSLPRWQQSFKTEEFLLQGFALVGGVGGVVGWIMRKK